MIAVQGKHDSKQGGAEEWGKRVDAVSIVSVTLEKVILWKNKRIQTHEGNPVGRNRAIVTTNSLIRNARALFAKRMIAFMRAELQLPEGLPFDGVALDKNPSFRYHSTIDAKELLGVAHEQLATEDGEAYDVFLLALVCGLRRAEIDSLLWSQFDLEKSSLRIERKEYYELKNEDSSGSLDLDERTLGLFREFRALAMDEEFVVKSPFKSANHRPSRGYRCDAVFNRLNKWLREHGVDVPKPLHTLRREIGSVIASQYGIFEASRYLRHSDIRITAVFYADEKQQVVPDLTESRGAISVIQISNPRLRHGLDHTTEKLSKESVQIY
ncbi:MAG: tyrosine-type recombinase/integrase [Verrucomicrobiaceae bacterium]|nr:tyrosine-type recombinase/integrase [Verrucomicrobiaceae bacterium]